MNYDVHVYVTDETAWPQKYTPLIKNNIIVEWNKGADINGLHL